MKHGKHNAANVLHHIIVPKADDFVSKCFQMGSSFLIVLCLLQVLTR